MAQEIGETPARGLNRLRLANPAQLLLDAPSNRSEQIGRLEFGQGRDLGFRDATVGPLEDGRAQRLGQFILPSFGPAHLTMMALKESMSYTTLDGTSSIGTRNQAPSIRGRSLPCRAPSPPVSAS